MGADIPLKKQASPQKSDNDSVDYATFHDCACGGSHHLRPYPAKDGFVVAVCCDTCRDDAGRPTRYSTETDPFPTFDQAERSRKALLQEAA